MSNTTNTYCSEFAAHSGSRIGNPLLHGNNSLRRATLKLRSIVGWYRILRGHHQFTVPQAIRAALWLGR
jgi:hypothetical protein